MQDIRLYILTYAGITSETFKYTITIIKLDYNSDSYWLIETKIAVANHYWLEDPGDMKVLWAVLASQREGEVFVSFSS